jgi:hypothetical protein
VAQALERVRQAARQRKKEGFTALLHRINIASLRLAFFALKRDAAPGVDGVASVAEKGGPDPVRCALARRTQVNR